MSPIELTFDIDDTSRLQNAVGQVVDSCSLANLAQFNSVTCSQLFAALFGGVFRGQEVMSKGGEATPHQRSRLVAQQCLYLARLEVAAIKSYKRSPSVQILWSPGGLVV